MLQPKVTESIFKKLVSTCEDLLAKSDAAIIHFNQRGDPQLTAMIFTLAAAILYANERLKEEKTC